MSERQRATHGLSAPLLEVRDLTVYHGQLRALTGVSLTVEPGHSLRFRYRVVIHPGDLQAIDAPALFQKFAALK